MPPQTKRFPDDVICGDPCCALQNYGASDGIRNLEMQYLFCVFILHRRPRSGGIVNVIFLPSLYLWTSATCHRNRQAETDKHELNQNLKDGRIVGQTHTHTHTHTKANTQTNIQTCTPTTSTYMNNGQQEAEPPPHPQADVYFRTQECSGNGTQSPQCIKNGSHRTTLQRKENSEH